MEVEELFSYTLTDVKDLDQLMHELSSTSFCNDTILDAIISDENSHAYVLRDENHIVAAGSLCIIHTLEFTNAVIEGQKQTTNWFFSILLIGKYLLKLER